MKKATCVQTIRSHHADVLCCAFRHNLLAVGSNDKLVRLFSVTLNGASWNFAELPQSPLCGHGYLVAGVCFDANADTLISCSQDGRAIVWDVAGGKKTACIAHESQAALKVAKLSPDGQMLATGGDDDTAAFWHLQSRTLLRLMEGHESSVVTVAFSPDGSLLVTGSSLGDLRVWDARYGSGRYLHLVKEAHDLGVMCSEFSSNHIPDTGPTAATRPMYTLATGGNDNLVKLWRVYTENSGDDPTRIRVREYTTLSGHSQNVMCLAFNHSGTLLASGGGDRTVIVWDTFSGERLQQLWHHDGYVTCVAFNDDATLLASGSNDKTVALWALNGSTTTNSTDVPTDAYTLVDLREQSPFEVKTLGQWTVSDVVDWLKSIDMDGHSAVFENNAIDGRELIMLTDGMLRTALGIESLGHRNRILRAIKQLRDDRGGSNGDETQSCVIKKNSSQQLSKSPVSTHSNGGHLPNEYFCPITHEVMADPVIAADGYTYERSAIENWMTGKGRRSSPMTNATFSHMELTPNRMLKMLIQRTNPVLPPNAK